MENFTRLSYSVEGIRESRADILKAWEQVKEMRLKYQETQLAQVDLMAENEHQEGAVEDVNMEIVNENHI
jgi:hypothetical protein